MSPNHQPPSRHRPLRANDWWRPGSGPLVGSYIMGKRDPPPPRAPPSVRSPFQKPWHEPRASEHSHTAELDRSQGRVGLQGLAEGLATLVTHLIVCTCPEDRRAGHVGGGGGER